MLSAVRILRRIKRSPLKKLLIAADKAQRERNWPKAIENYTRFLDSSPENAAIWVQLGHAHKELSHFDQAEAAYREALRAEPAYDDALLHLSRMLQVLGREQAAIALAPTSMSDVTNVNTPSTVIETREATSSPQLSDSRRGDLARDGKDWLSAAVFYSRYLHEHPRDGGIWTQLGHVLKEQLLLDEAVFAYQVAARFEDASSDVSLHLAALLMRMGSLVDATPMWASMFSKDQRFFLPDK